MKQKKIVRICDIASEVGVSCSLVSKVLCGRMGNSTVRPALAERIKSVAKLRGYVPNASAKALFSGRQNTVAVFVSRHGHPESDLTEKFIDGVVSELSKTNRRMLLQFFHDEEDFRANCMPAAVRAVTDGAVVGGFPYFDIRPMLEAVIENGLPVATAFSNPISTCIPNSGVSQEQVGYCAARHLIECGCRRPLFFHVNEADGHLRLSGFRRMMAEAGLHFGGSQIYEIGSFDSEEASVRMAAPLLSKMKYDGIAAESDSAAVLMMNAMLAAGIRIPENVRVLGIDDSPLCRFTMVPLSSISGRDQERGARAIRLLDKIGEGGEPENEELDPVVVPRASTIG